MHTITVYPRRPPSLQEVQDFVRSLPEGDWVTGGQLSRGVVESDDARVYLDYDDRFRDYFDKFLDAQEQTALSARLGFPPVLALHVHASNVMPGSKELAHQICARLVGLWGGFSE